MTTITQVPDHYRYFNNPVAVRQDGAVFYRASDGAKLFHAGIRTYDAAAEQRARATFITWCGGPDMIYPIFDDEPVADAPVARLNEPQIAALIQYASTNGRRWKSKLLTTWESGRVENPELQQIRNIIGPSGLAKFRL